MSMCAECILYGISLLADNYEKDGYSNIILDLLELHFSIHSLEIDRAIKNLNDTM